MNKSFNSTILFRALMILSFAIVIGYLIIGETIMPAEARIGMSEYVNFSDGWTLERADGSREVVDLPYTLNDNAGEECVILSKALPTSDIGNRWLLFWNRGNNLVVSIADQSRLEYNTEGSRLLGFTSPYAYMFIPVAQDDEGETIVIEVYARNDTLEEIYLGDRFAFTNMLARSFFPEIALAAVLLFFGMIFYIVAVILKRINVSDNSLLRYYSLTVIITTIWVLTNSGGRQFIFPNISTVRDVAFLAFAALPYPYIRALEIIQKNRYSTAFLIAKVLVIAGFFVQFIPYALGVCDFDYTQLLPVIANVYCILLVLITIIMDIRKGRHKEYHFMAEAYIGTTVLACIQLILFEVMDGVLTGLVLEVGLVWGMIFTIISSINQLLELNYEKNEALFQSKAKGEFLANMSHEIRTPINAVLGMDEMILREAEDEEILGYAQNIKQAGTTLLNLINDILDFSKIESGKMDIIPVTYNTGSVINDLVVLVGHRAENKGLKLRVQVDENIPSELIGDDVRLKQIITNLLTNAVKYTPSGEVVLSVSLESQQEETCVIRVSVEDTGIGIKEEDKAKLFESFQRVDESRNRNIEGTGLGLSITLMLLKLMGSTLEVESEYEKGSVFSFSVEQRVANAEPIGDFAKKYQNATGHKKKYQASFYAPEGRILVVDDNAVNLMVIKGLLKLTGLRIDTAESGQEALNKMKENHYHVIFMDHMMPNMDGIEAREISLTMEGNLCKESKMIILTANAVAGAREMYLEKGFDDYLAKPIETKEMERQLIQYLPAELLMDRKSKDEGGLIDRALGIEKCSNDELLYMSISMAFKEDNGGKLLDKFLAEDNLNDYLSEIQGIKESLIYIGAVHTAELANRIENFYEKQDYDGIKRMHPEFVTELEQVAAQL